MEKYILVGHNADSLNKVFEKLIANGLRNVIHKNQTYKNVKELTKILYNINEFSSVYEFLEKDMHPQIQPIWEKYIINILVENLDNKNYGWIDSDILPFAEIMIELDSTFKFVIVVSHPFKCLKNSNNKDNLYNELNKWKKYYEKAINLSQLHKENFIVLVEDEFLIDNYNKAKNRFFKFLDSNSFKNKIEIKENKNDKIEKYFFESLDGDFFKILLDFYYNLSDEFSSKRKLLKNTNFIIEDFVELINKNSSMQEENTKLKQVNYIINTDNLNKTAELHVMQDIFEKVLIDKNKLEFEIETYRSQVDKYLYELNSLKNYMVIMKEKSDETNSRFEILQGKALYRLNLNEKLSKEINLLKENIKNNEEVLKENYELINNLKLSNEILYLQMHEIQSEFEKSYMEKYFLNNFNKNELKSAKEIIVDSKQYKIGSVLIESTKSFKGFYESPFKIYNIIKKEGFFDNEAINDLSKFSDYEQAKKYENHLAFKLGRLIYETEINNKAIVTLPLNLIKEIYSFRKAKTKVGVKNV